MYTTQWDGGSTIFVLLLEQREKMRGERYVEYRETKFFIDKNYLGHAYIVVP